MSLHPNAQAGADVLGLSTSAISGSRALPGSHSEVSRCCSKAEKGQAPDSLSPSARQAQ